MKDEKTRLEVRLYMLRDALDKLAFLESTIRNPPTGQVSTWRLAASLFMRGLLEAAYINNQNIYRKLYPCECNCPPKEAIN